MIDDDVKLIVWEGKLRGYSKRRNNFAEGTKKAFATIWDMCSPTLQSKLKQLDGYENMLAARNPVELIEAIQNTVCG